MYPGKFPEDSGYTGITYDEREGWKLVPCNGGTSPAVIPDASVLFGFWNVAYGDAINRARHEAEQDSYKSEP